jgi:hypothetical protein
MITSRKPTKATWTGPAVKTLRAIYGDKSPVGLFVSRARQLVQQSRITGPPFNPYTYARILGIDVEEDQDVGLDGFLTCDENKKFRIHIKSDAHPHRKNFTLAHEISHTFFYHDFIHPNSRWQCKDSDQEEERLCDMAAEELLMPTAAFKRDLDGQGYITPTTIKWLTKRYEVSLQAAAIRTWKTTRTVGCALWKRAENRFDLVWSTPIRLKKIMLCQTGRTSIEEAIKDPGSVSTCLDTFYGLEGCKHVRRKTSSIALQDGKILSVIDLTPDSKIANRIS